MTCDIDSIYLNNVLMCVSLLTYMGKLHIGDFKIPRPDDPVSDRCCSSLDHPVYKILCYTFSKGSFGFSTRNAHMVHIVNLIRLKWCIHLRRSFYCNFVGLLHHPSWLQLLLALYGHYFSTFYTTRLAQDH